MSIADQFLNSFLNRGKLPTSHVIAITEKMRNNGASWSEVQAALDKAAEEYAKDSDITSLEVIEKYENAGMYQTAERFRRLREIENRK